MRRMEEALQVGRTIEVNDQLAMSSDESKRIFLWCCGYTDRMNADESRPWTLVVLITLSFRRHMVDVDC